MNEEKQYKIDFEKVENTFKFKDNGLTHSQGNQFKLLPYAANEKTLVSNFNGVVGAFSRCICDKDLKNEFNFNEFIENIVEEIGEFEGVTSKEVFRDIVKTMFINNKNLEYFDIKTINYIASTNSDEKIAKFLYSIFFDDELKNLVMEYYDRDVDKKLGTKATNYWIQDTKNVKPKHIATLGKNDKVNADNSLTDNLVKISSKDGSAKTFILTFSQDIPKGEEYKLIICYVTVEGAPPYSGDNGAATFVGK